MNKQTCVRCQKTLHNFFFKIKKNGMVSKTCYNCSSNDIINGLHKLDTINLRNYSRYLNNELVYLKNSIAEQIQECENRIRNEFSVRLDNLTRLDMKGNVYLDKLPEDDEYFPITFFARMVFPRKLFQNDPLDESMSAEHILEVIRKNNAKKKIIISIGNKFAAQWKRVHGIRAERTKKRIDLSEAVKGRTGLKNIYPKKHMDWIVSVLDKYEDEFLEELTLLGVYD